MAQEPSSGPLVPPQALWRFSLRQLLGWTAFIALGCVALRSAGPVWFAALYAAALVAMASAVLLAIFRQRELRAYWIGFATFGCLYLLVLNLSWSLRSLAPSDSPLQTGNLITTRISDWCYHRIYDAAFVAAGVASGDSVFGGSMPGGMMGSADSGMSGYTASGDYGSTAGAYGGAYSGDGSMANGYGGGYGAASSGMPGMGSGTPPPAAPTFTGPSKRHFINVAHTLWVLVLAACGGWLARWLYATGPK
jgi:hypothetical protein